jgi:hypothetical protein
VVGPQKVCSGGAVRGVTPSYHCRNVPAAAELLSYGGEVGLQPEAGPYGPGRRARCGLDVVEYK